MAAARDQPRIVRDIDRLLDNNTDRQIAAILNERDVRSGEGKRFSRTMVARIRRDYSLTPRYDRLRAAGMVTVQEMAAILGVYFRLGENLEPAWAASRSRQQRQK